MTDLQNPSHCPALGEMAEYIQSPLFPNFCTDIKAKYNVKEKLEFSSCSWEHGWNMKFKQSGKNLCTVYPRESYFTVLFVVGRKEKESVEAILPECTAFWKSGRTGNIFPQKPDHHIIIPRLVGKRAAGTVFEPFSAAFQIRGISRTVFLCIQRTVAEQAVKISHLLMAGKIFA